MSGKTATSTQTQALSPTTPELASDFLRIRAYTEKLSEPLSAEDQTIQSSVFASPTKWHRAHTTWFFEEFILATVKNYSPFHDSFSYLFNSYYETVGPRAPRPARGMITRPGVKEVGEYRQAVDEAILEHLPTLTTPELRKLVHIGLHHEQQHQELLLMDALHALSQNPLNPAYCLAAPPQPDPVTPTAQFKTFSEGLYSIGHDGPAFAYDNESPRHKVWLEPFAIAQQLVTCADWLQFMADDGYHNATLWTSDGWAMAKTEGWTSPLYWQQHNEEWHHFAYTGCNRSTWRHRSVTLVGTKPMRLPGGLGCVYRPKLNGK